MALEDHVRQRVPMEIAGRSAYDVIPAAGRIKLDAMESPYAWPPALQAEWLSTLHQVELNRYPDPTAFELCEDLRHWSRLGDEMGLLLGNGSDELIQMIIMVLGGPVRPVLAPEPTFGMYRIIAEALGRPFVGVPLADGFAIDRTALLSAIETHDPGCIFLAYPNNPTGNLFERETIEAAINVANGLVIIDEAYHPYCGQTFLNEVPGKGHLAVLRTFSKLGLAGLRLGFLTGPKPWLAEINKVRLPYNISVLAQASVRFALSHGDWFTQQAEKVCAERCRLHNALQEMVGLRVYPSAANFLLFRTPKGTASWIFDSLLQQNILIKNLDGQHDRLRDCLRVTVGTPDENSFFLDALSIAIKR
jgi:histidinol-phosphate aminotransferase